MPDQLNFTDGQGSGSGQGGGYGGGADWVSSLVNAGAAIYSSEVSRQNTKKNIKAAKEQAELAYQRELEMWNKQNDYNNPLNQMARLKAAGLNPNMMYGSGSGSASGNAAPASTPKYNAPTLQYNYQPINIPQVLGAYQDFRIKQAQINNLNANEENTRARTITEAARNTLVDMQGQDKKAEYWGKTQNQYYDYAGRMGQLNADNASIKLKEEYQKLQLLNQQELQRNVQMQYMKKQMTMMDIDKEKKEAETMFQNYKNDWMKAGITTSDNWMLRVLVRMFNESGLNAGDMFK